MSDEQQRNSYQCLLFLGIFVCLSYTITKPSLTIQRPFQETREQAKLARDNGIVMYAIGVGRLGPDLDEEELTGIAGVKSRVLTADSYAELNLIKNNLINLACEGSEYFLFKNSL